MMRELIEGESYLIRTKKERIYIGVFDCCAKRPYIGSKSLRMVEIFRNVYCKSPRGLGLNHFDYLHMLGFNIKDVIKIDFNKSQFLNTPKTELIRCFDNAIR